MDTELLLTLGNIDHSALTLYQPIGSTHIIRLSSYRLDDSHPYINLPFNI